MQVLLFRAGVATGRKVAPTVIGFAFVAFLLAPVLLVVVIFGISSDDNTSDQSCVTVTANPSGGTRTVADLGSGWEGNAAAILSVVTARNLPSKAGVVALATAMQESRLFNNPGGDRDSVGLFQQRASWGATAQRMDPAWATGAFLDGLVRVPGWQLLPVTVAAQKVQRSAFPDAYAQWTDLATSIAAGSTSTPPLAGADNATTVCTGIADGGFTDSGVAATGTAKTAIDAAMQWLGTPYSWGGGGTSGPTRGIAQGANTVGFDCSGLVQYGWAKAGVSIPGTTASQWAASGSYRVADKSALQPGDLLYFGPGGSIDHVGMYLGGGRMVHAPKTGDVVKVIDDVLTSPYWTSRYVGATHPVQSHGVKA